MDRSQLTGILLIFLLLMVYFQFFAPEPAVLEKDSPTENTVVTRPEETQPAAHQRHTLEDSVRIREQQERLGLFAAGAVGTEKEVVLENKNIKITFTSRGGNIKSVLLKDYLTWDKRPLYLLDEESSKMDYFINTTSERINLSELYFNTDAQSAVVANGDSLSINFILDLGEGRSITKTYSLGGRGFELGQRINLQGLENVVQGENAVFHWINTIQRAESNLEESITKTTINYFTMDGDFDNLSETSKDREEETFRSSMHWVAMKQKFFTAAIISDNGFRSGRIAKEAIPEDTMAVKRTEMELNIALADLQAGRGDFKFYFGPNNYQILKNVTEGFSRNINLGWPVINWFNRFLIIPIFNFLENYIANYGIIIIILVLIIKLLLMPLSYKSYVSIAKTKVLKPELDEIKEKYGDDMQKAQSEQMKLYSKVGVNPLSGCVPVLLQMPILFAMFQFFPNSIELRQESFLWAEDLSTFDSILNLPFTIPVYGSHISLFTILMTASTIGLTWMNSQMSTVQGPMKSMQYMMPVIFMFVLNSFPAGLTFYYFISNIVTVGQQALIRQFVDEDKIREILEENKKRNANKTKSKFQMRLEEAMKASQQTKDAKDKDKDKGKKK
jgi:YidC/Oxa1 family membrane protein insertase